MKKTLQSLGVAAALTLGVNANAQLPDYGVYPGGLMLNEFGAGGDIWDVDSILDSGTPVLIDMFAVWCGPCWSYHTGGTLEDLYLSTGWGGPGDVAIFGVESDAGEPEADMDGGASAGGSTTQQGDWTAGTLYPMINHDGIASMMNLAYYPTLILICPDRTVTEVGQATEAEWITAIGDCGAIATAGNDLRTLENLTPTTAYTCGGGTVNQTFEVAIQNYSTVNITGSKTINVMNGATVVGTANVSVNLDPYEAMVATVTGVPLALGANPFTTVIFGMDDDLTNNTISTPVTVSNATNVGTGDLVLHVTVDAYAEEVGFLFASGLPYQDDAQTAYDDADGGSYTGLVEFSAIGTWPGAGTGQGTVHHVPLYGLAAGCYHLSMFDGYGDGMLGYDGAAGGTGTSQDGSMTLESESGYNGSVPVSYGSYGTWSFQVTTAGNGGFTGMEEAETVTTASVYPNPATDMTNIEFNVSSASEVQIVVLNTLGQVVYDNYMGEVNGTQKVALNTANFEAGIYMINITVNGNMITKRVNVIK